VRREDDRFATGRGQYADDLQRPGALRAAFVRSPYPSATIRSIDTAAARQHPGVVAVLTGADMLADGFLDCPIPFQLQQGDGTAAAETPRPWLARDQVRYVGEPVVMVLARSQAAALDAAELVAIDYEERECVLDVASARASSAPQLWDGRVGNVAYHWRGGDAAKTEAALAASARVVRLTTTVTRVAAMPLEPRTALAYIGDDGRPVIHLSHQSPHQFRDELVKLFRLEPAQLRVIAGDVGGSFGMKFGPQREEVLVFWAALRTKQAVRWTAARGESFLADEHARDVVIHAELGLDAAGRFSALRVRYEANIGAYMSARSGTPISNIGGISGVYTLPAICAEVLGIFTNTQATAAYRGAGRPDATYAIERVIDHAAAETGIDPAELRRRNLIPADAMPYRTGFIFEYDCGDFARTLARGLELARYASFPQRREEAQGRGMLRGIGIALPIEQAGGIGGDRATVQAHEDGTFTIRAGSMSVGQGHETGFTRLVVQALGIDPDKVRYVQGDTDSLPAGRGNGGSSAAIQGGSAMRHAVDDFVAKARAAAASELEAHPADLELDRGAFRVRGTDHHIGFADLARKAQGDLVGLGAFQPGRPTFPNGCHVCEVEIDPATGEVRLVHYASVEDVGRVLNPVLVEGQIHGGVVQGIGQVLQEQICYDRYGQLLTGSFMDYALPRPADVPPMVVETMEIPTALNPLGVKGVGEAGTVGAMSAAMNAICHALRSAGVQHFDMPATPCRVWEALRS
jgi:carbon-monoxide dehydrogenase large subunit